MKILIKTLKQEVDIDDKLFFDNAFGVIDSEIWQCRKHVLFITTETKETMKQVYFCIHYDKDRKTLILTHNGKIFISMTAFQNSICQNKYITASITDQKEDLGIVSINEVITLQTTQSDSRSDQSNSRSDLINSIQKLSIEQLMQLQNLIKDR